MSESPVPIMHNNLLPILSVRPIRALVDEPFKVLVENLRPGSPVTLHSLHLSEDGDYTEAFGHYVSSEWGTVSVADDFSFGGTYSGKEPMGLLWSQRPVPGGRRDLRLMKTVATTPMLVHISVYSGHLTGGFQDQVPLASVLTERWYMAPGVKRVSVKEGNILGTLFIPPGPGPFPGLLDMWGGGGGLIEYRAALLASHGYVSFALPYVSPDQGPVDERLFESVFNMIKTHPQVIPDKVGLFGLSLGAIITLYLAMESKVVRPACCVCISGTHSFIRDKDSAQSISLDTLGDYSKVRVDENNHSIWHDITLPISTDFSRKLDMSKINCPLMLVSGTDDQNVASVEAAEDMAQMIHAAGKDHLLTKLVYPGAGHVIQPPFAPHCRFSWIMDVKKGQKYTLLWGGQTKPHSDAQEDSWKKILAFLQMHLYSSSSPRARM
ncbi:peroxisomal succinyl-coenzyme A thioesterase-like [Synchiropus splendidus]|uniref:peroxisomal succinyl-coenzyme A thioesterase-like n=1 Tax=Synchiropus splendidus TaxID=270530 RepID=UPI00237DFEB3|nr:peroxisomal succinyl-coenzyme A thioesterase-like [Synchiropus splendidus]